MIHLQNDDSSCDQLLKELVIKIIALEVEIAKKGMLTWLVQRNLMAL